MSQTLEEILLGIRNGRHEDFDALRRKYAPLISSTAASFEQSGGGSRVDLTEEAESALLRAALSYDIDNCNVSFGLYAKICIRNALVSFRRAKLSRERREKSSADAESRKRRRKTELDGVDADEILERIGGELSDYERAVLLKYTDGNSAAQTAAELGTSERSVNNALYRARRKLRDRRPSE
ncbi:MAG: sigma-70 family RNA polymerase sigma factor [Candidatus Avispirillum sp.]